MRRGKSSSPFPAESLFRVVLERQRYHRRYPEWVPPPPFLPVWLQRGRRVSSIRTIHESRTSLYARMYTDRDNMYPLHRERASSLTPINKANAFRLPGDIMHIPFSYARGDCRFAKTLTNNQVTATKVHTSYVREIYKLDIATGATLCATFVAVCSNTPVLEPVILTFSRLAI